MEGRTRGFPAECLPTLPASNSYSLHRSVVTMLCRISVYRVVFIDTVYTTIIDNCSINRIDTVYIVLIAFFCC